VPERWQKGEGMAAGSVGMANEKKCRSQRVDQQNTCRTTEIVERRALEERRLFTRRCNEIAETEQRECRDNKAETLLRVRATSCPGFNHVSDNAYAFAMPFTREPMRVTRPRVIDAVIR